jgi:S1-C subfamily serine protease
MVVPPRLALAVATRAVQRFLAAPRRPRLGIRFRPVGLPPPLVQRLALPSDRGLIVVEVLPDSVAARAGILPGDVLLAVDDRAIHPPRLLVDRLARWDGEPLRFRLLRGGAVRAIVVDSASAR